MDIRKAKYKADIIELQKELDDHWESLERITGKSAGSFLKDEVRASLGRDLDDKHGASRVMSARVRLEIFGQQALWPLEKP